MLFFVEPFGYGKERVVGQKKVYTVDTGLRNAVSRTTRDIGRQVENLVFLNLRRFTDEVYYYSKDNREIDFIARIDRTLYAIECKWETEGIEQKIHRAKEIAKKLEAKFMVITKDMLGRGQIPLWLFLLTKPNRWIQFAEMDEFDG